MVGLDHIALIVSSEESIQFYEKLGFKETKRIERSYDTVVFMRCGQVGLEIFIDPKHPERVSDPEAKGLRHIAFSVNNWDKVLKNIGCESVQTDWFGRKFTFTVDPDGQPIELIEQKTEINSANFKTDEKWVQEYREQFGTEPNFM
ncbi:hypothetical protein Lac2_25560 [Claveliimonas bilis]|uniref:VOC family protein n=1 Tax=Claveliimonas bilis TaxID=3028070 RepID=UPI00292E84C5|nr:VOC family protein [Claveliimonas bilis]BDZ84422.1 hypothetical protein Lac2_25560 [Claveliimonas bilis]